MPFDAQALFGEARPPVRGTVNGVPFRSRLMVYGGVTWLGLRNEQRREAGLSDGDSVDVAIERDDSPREGGGCGGAIGAAPDLSATPPRAGGRCPPSSPRHWPPTRSPPARTSRSRS